MNDEVIREIITVRGIAAAIQQMSSPSFRSLDDLLRKEGYKLEKLSQNKQTNSENNRQRGI